MIILVTMSASDFAEFSKYTVENYANDKALTGEWPREEAQQNAEEMFRKLLPQGMATAGHCFYTIVDPQFFQPVGHIWLQIRGEGAKRDAFIMDHVIHEQFRNRGYGSQSLLAMESKLLAMGIEKVGAHVAGHNTRSRRVLEGVGFQVIGIDLSKNLRKTDRS